LFEKETVNEKNLQINLGRKWNWICNRQSCAKKKMKAVLADNEVSAHARGKGIKRR
jgi:hypothetical protein